MSPASGHSAPFARRVTWSHRLEFALLKALRVVLRGLPESAALTLGEAFGAFAGGVLRLRHEVVHENLSRAFPELDASRRKRLALASWRHLGREGVAFMRSIHTGPASQQTADIISRTEVEGLENLEQALAEGRGAILVTGHLGSWEMAGAALAARGVALDAVALVQANPLFDGLVREAREALGLRLIERGNAMRQVPRSLRAGRAVGLVADQNARTGGVFIDFFGHCAATFRGPALFAIRTGAPIFVGACMRSSKHPQRYQLMIERIAFEPSGDLEADVLRLTQAHSSALERWVRTAPEQYFWAHNRWKTQPGETPPASSV